MVKWGSADQVLSFFVVLFVHVDAVFICLLQISAKAADTGSAAAHDCGILKVGGLYPVGDIVGRENVTDICLAAHIHGDE